MVSSVTAYVLLDYAIPYFNQCKWFKESSWTFKCWLTYSNVAGDSANYNRAVRLWTCSTRLSQAVTIKGLGAPMETLGKTPLSLCFPSSGKKCSLHLSMHSWQMFSVLQTPHIEAELNFSSREKNNIEMVNVVKMGSTERCLTVFSCFVFSRNCCSIRLFSDSLALFW